ncbi:MAG: Gfo/Idh/MocA family oxidoreductase [Solirubrobacterales bacterium]
MTSADSGPSIALVGTGKWGRHILRDLVSLGCIVHVVARSESSRANAAELAASIVSGVDELPPVEAAVAAPITTKHAEVIDTLAARIDGPIFVEKPLSDSLADARRLADSFGDRLFVMDKWRYHPGVLELARVAQSGEIGAVQSIHTRRVSDRNRHPDVNTVWTHAPHDLAISYEILGEIPPLVSATGEYSSGGLVGLVATLGGPPWVNLEFSDCAPALRRELRVVGSLGSAHLEGGGAEPIVVRPHDGAPEREIATPGELPLLAELRAFVEHVKGGPAPKSSADLALAQVERITEMLEMADRVEGRA